MFLFCTLPTTFPLNSRVENKASFEFVLYVRVDSVNLKHYTKFTRKYHTVLVKFYEIWCSTKWNFNLFLIRVQNRRKSVGLNPFFGNKSCYKKTCLSNSVIFSKKNVES